MKIKKDFFLFSIFKFFFLIFILNFSFEIDLLSSCNDAQYYDYTTSLCVNCPTNSTPSNSKLTCDCTNSSEYFNLTNNKCSSCTEDFGNNFGINLERNGCINCSDIINSNTNGDVDEETKKCKCGNGKVLFYNNKNYTCFSQNDTTDGLKFNNDSDSIYENDNNVCIGIGYFLYNSSSETSCNCKENYSLIEYKVNKSLSINLCIPNITNNNNNTRRLQTNNTAQIFNERDYTIFPYDYQTLINRYINEIIRNETLCKSTNYQDDSCNVLANFCVLSLYTVCDKYINIWNEAQDNPNNDLE
jgi:hypothetical protein